MGKARKKNRKKPSVNKKNSSGAKTNRTGKLKGISLTEIQNGKSAGKHIKKKAESGTRISAEPEEGKRAEPARQIRQNAGSNLIHAGIWFAIFLVSLFYWEFFLYTRVHGSYDRLSGWVFAFIPAEAMILASLAGWFKNNIARRVTGTVLLGLVWFFYAAQLVYYRIFGSMFSISMAGMGADAIGNFWWALQETLLDSVGILLVLFLPVLLLILGSIFLKRNLSYRTVYHGCVFLLGILLWLAVVLLLPTGGKESYSAYAAYHSALVDTDTASGKIGILANSVVELKTRLFGGSLTDIDSDLNGDDSLAADAGATEDLGDDSDTEEPVNAEEEAEQVLDTSPNIYEDIDFTELEQYAEDEDTLELCKYLAAQTGTNRNEMTGFFEGCNLIYICAESFCVEALNPEITPTLCKLASGGIVLNNYYNSFKNTTTNGEYAFLTSLWPDVSRKAKNGTAVGSFAQSADNYMPLGVASLFNLQTGVTSRGYHNYKGSYYNRNNSWENLGFTCTFASEEEGDGGMTFTNSWPASDLEMMEQSVDDYINDDQFFTYYMTFSGHGPYTEKNNIYNLNIDETLSKIGDNGYTDRANGYLACNLELERAMEYLLERLEEAGKLNNTVIVLTGDHYPYYLDSDDYSSLLGHTVDEDFEIYKSTCIMYCAGMSEPMEVDTPCCNVDILPTVLNLFGISYDSRLLAGTDIFSDGTHVAALYNHSYVTDSVKYNSDTGEAEWLIDTSDYTEEELDDYVSSMLDYVKTKYSMSLKIADTDFYKFVWLNEGFATEDQIIVKEVVGKGANQTTTTNANRWYTWGTDTGTTAGNTAETDKGGDTGTAASGDTTGSKTSGTSASNAVGGSGNTGNTGNTGNAGTAGGGTGNTGNTGTAGNTDDNTGNAGGTADGGDTGENTGTGTGENAGGTAVGGNTGDNPGGNTDGGNTGDNTGAAEDGGNTSGDVTE